MHIELVIKHPWGAYTKGQHITDPDEIAEAEERHADCVIRVSMPDGTRAAERAQPPGIS